MILNKQQDAKFGIWQHQTNLYSYTTATVYQTSRHENPALIFLAYYSILDANKIELGICLSIRSSIRNNLGY